MPDAPTRGRPGVPDPDPTTLHVRRAKAGDSDSLDWLVRRFQPLLAAAARYRIGPALRAACDPEDLVAEVWMVALPALPDLDSRDGRHTPVLLRFLTTTLFNKVRELVRRQFTRGLANAAHDAGRDAASAGALAAPADGVSTRLGRAEARDAVHAALDAMDEKDREILVLRGIEQHPYAEISAALGVDENALGMRYARALKRLRERLPGSIFEEILDA